MQNSRQNDSISEAVPKDDLFIPGTYYSSNISYVATTQVLNRGIQIVRVIEKPNRPGSKFWYLQPEQEARKAYKEFVENQLSVNPQELALQVSIVKNLPAETNKPVPSFEPIDPNIRHNPEALKNWKNERQILSGNAEMEKDNSTQFRQSDPSIVERKS